MVCRVVITAVYLLGVSPPWNRPWLIHDTRPGGGGGALGISGWESMCRWEPGTLNL